jgi:predicted dehydrogenase
MPPSTIGLVGCGIWGRVILRDLLALGTNVIVAEIDRQGRDAALAGGATAVVNGASDLPAVDGLIVATPAATHVGAVASLLSRGVPMLVEKPFTTDVASAERLASQGAGRLFVSHTWRYHPGVELLGAIARSGELGPVAGLRSTRANWTSPRTDVDSIWNLAPHDLTLALEILGDIPEPRAAIAERHGTRVVGMHALLGRDPWLAFEVSNRYRDKRREVRLHCRDGVAVMLDPDGGQIEITHGDASSAPSAVTTERRSFSPESALTRELTAFLGFLKGGPPPKSPAAEGVEVVRTIVRLRALAGMGDGRDRGSD